LLKSPPKANMFYMYKYFHSHKGLDAKQREQCPKRLKKVRNLYSLNYKGSQTTGYLRSFILEIIYYYFTQFKFMSKSGCITGMGSLPIS